MQSLAPTDYVVLGFYLGFLVVVGFVFRRFNRDISDYFRGGGSMLWWMSGASALMSAMSAWSFTGATGSVYDTGTLVAAIYWSNAINLILVAAFTAGRFRRMRVITYAEAIRRRYGGVTEQFYVWVQLPVSVVKSGIELSALGVFLAAVFRTELLPTILIVGSVIVVVAMLGGAWAVVAGDFLQSVLMLTVLVLTVVFTFRLPEIGGFGGLLARVSPEHLHWGSTLRPGLVVLWCIAAFINSFFNFNNMSEGGARFLTAKDEQQARNAANAMATCFLFLPLLLLIPALAATTLFPNLHETYPGLRNPQEAAFVAVCVRAMPAGMIGLLVAGIFGVATASMDTGLNRNSGLLVRNLWQRLVRPAATDRELLLSGKIATLGLGAVIVGIAAVVALYSELDLFNLILAFGSLVSLPLMIPTVLGLFTARAPSWAGWTTPVVGLAAGWAIRSGIGMKRIASALGWTGPTSLELTTLSYAATVVGVVLACSAWFGFVMWVARNDPLPDHVRSFFADLNRPIVGADERPANDSRQFRTMGALALFYGAGIGLLAAAVNSTASRAGLGVCAVVLLTVGLVLRRAGARQRMEAVA